MSNQHLRQRWRHSKDLCARHLVTLGGISVIGALMLIFVYLLTMVLPLFRSPSVMLTASYPLPGSASPSLYLGIEEQNQLGVRLTADGVLTYFNVVTGAVQEQMQLRLPPATTVKSVRVLDETQGRLALQLSDDRLLWIEQTYRLNYAEAQQQVIPQIHYPLGKEPLSIASTRFDQLAAHLSADQLVVAIRVGVVGIQVKTFERNTSLLDETSTLTAKADHQITAPFAVDRLLLSPDQRWMYALSSQGELAFYDLHADAKPKLLQILSLFPHPRSVLSAGFLSGGYSLITTSAEGEVSQWFPVRDADNRYSLRFIRAFEAMDATTSMVMAAEQRRRGFAFADAEGRVSLYYATSERQLLIKPLVPHRVTQLAFSPRADRLMLETQVGGIHIARVVNPHPEVSWQALWGKVWYEGYAEPNYTWQSSAASNDFEPKLSLAPLTFGSVKAALYAMLVAVPFALMAAIYTAFFMTPALRQWVKPGIEVIQALPTVIIGFVAGLWLAPVVESNLAGLLCVFFLMPVAMLLLAILWPYIPEIVRRSCPEGWQALWLLPLLFAFGWLCFQLGGMLDQTIFAGGLPTWLDQTMGIHYDQRNALVVGLAMGFATIPMIYSIAEDALFSVPKALSNGSLALGATQWQTVMRVVLPTASPGIFSAVMMGFGRAVGETMIVLMATGNTAIMDFSILEGLRTLSANIAVEMPESAVGSTHFRVLFLAALVLFLFTFVFNTAAEIIRQRLRTKYSNL